MSEEELPAGWVETRLDAVAEVRLGRQRSPDRATGPNMAPYMRAANVTWNGLSLHDVKEMDFSPAERPAYELRKGDVLVGEASGSRAEVGKSALWQGEIPGACFQNTLIRVRPQGGLIDSGFLQLRLKHDALRGALADASRGVGIHHLGREALAGWEVPLPPLNEQRRIVAKLEDLLARSRRAKHALDAVPPLLEKLRQSILASAFRGDLTADWRAQHPDVEPASELLKRIRLERRKKWEEAELKKLKAKGKAPSDERWKQKYQEPEPVDTSELPELPEGWCWASVDEVASIDGGLTKNAGRRGGSSEYVPLVSVAAVYMREIRDTEIGEIAIVPEDGDRGLLHLDDLLIVEGNGSLDQIGRVAKWDRSLSKARHQNHLIRVRPFVLSSDYVLEWLASPLGRDLIQQQATSATGLYNLSLSKVSRIAVPVPSYAEAQFLLSEVKKRLELVARVTLAMKALAETQAPLAASLLAKAFRGELVPQDPSDEPASLMLERLAQARAAGEASAPKRSARKAGQTKLEAKKVSVGNRERRG